MILHHFKYTFITLFKNKMLVFWTFAFPIILGTFFYMAFSDIENSEKLSVFNIAVVENDYLKDNSYLKEVMDSLSSGNDALFNTQYVSVDTAESLLDKKEIEGYVEFSNQPKIVVKQSGINETILKFVTEEILQTESIFKNFMVVKMAELPEEARLEMDSIMNSISFQVQELLNKEVNIKDTTNSHISYTMIEYYTLIAMTCLYGGIIGMTAVNQNLANMSQNGKRIAVAPISKGKIILSSVMAGYLIQLIGLFLLFLYTIFVLHVDYGTYFLYVVLLALVGSLAGLMMGVAISALCKTNENTKIGLVIAVTMFGCFLSGMMGITMKYIVDTNIPLLNKINPANMITDGFYSLYYYGVNNRFFIDVISLLVFSLILLVLSIRSLRRQTYDSI